MWTDSLWPGARVTAVQCSTWEPTAPVIAQLTGPEAIDQFTPEPAGNGSLIVTPVAEPVPAALELETPIVNPIWDPAETVASSAVLGSDSAGHWTVAEPVPAALELETPIVNPIWDPAETVASSAVLVIDSAGHWTVTEAVELSLPALPVLTDAVLLTKAQSALVVADVTWIGPRLPPPAKEPRLQFRTWEPTRPVIAQPEKAGDSDQLRSPPAGSESETWTLVAVPAPELD